MESGLQVPKSTSARIPGMQKRSSTFAFANERRIKREQRRETRSKTYYYYLGKIEKEELSNFPYHQSKKNKEDNQGPDGPQSTMKGKDYGGGGPHPLDDHSSQIKRESASKNPNPGSTAGYPGKKK